MTTTTRNSTATIKLQQTVSSQSAPQQLRVTNMLDL